MEKTKETSEKKLILIDPPSGWMYGFPKAITQEQYKAITNLKQWCIDNGYPLSEAITYGEYFNIQISGDLSFMKEKTSNRKQSNRRQAISWWNNLTFGKQCFIRSKYHPQERSLDSLTGREIEEIWEKEFTNELNGEFEKLGSSLRIKPNQKQFVEFNEDLFLSYINKFSDLGKRKAIEMLLKNCDFQKAELIKDNFNLKLQITKF